MQSLPDNGQLVEAMAQELFHSPVRATIWKIAHLSVVSALELESGTIVIAKARAFEPRLRLCNQLQAEAARRGFPCARTLAEVQVQGDVAISFESYLADGDYLDVGPPTTRVSAQAFAELVTTLAAVDCDPNGLHPPVPWIWWDHSERGMWPVPDDLEVDLNARAGPEMVDRAGRRIRTLLSRYAARDLVIGHGDWEAQNIFWRDGSLHAVHDWDSLVGRPEAFLVGPAAAVHAVRWQTPGRPPIAQILEFIDHYVETRELSWWTEIDRKAAIAAGVWVHFFNARKTAEITGDRVTADPYLRSLLRLLEYCES